MNLVNPFILTPVSSDILNEPFNDSSFNSSLWTRKTSDTHITYTETSLLTIDSDSSGGSDALISVANYDVLNTAFNVEMKLYPFIPSGEFLFGWQKADFSRYCGFRMYYSGSGPTWQSAYDIGSGMVTNLLEPVISHSYSWGRLRYDNVADVMYWDLGHDGVGWVNFDSYASFAATFGFMSVVKLILEMTSPGMRSSECSYLRIYG